LTGKMNPPPTLDDRKVGLLRCAIIFDEPAAWKVVAVWALSLAGGDCKIGDEVHASRLQNLTGIAKEDAQRWARVLSSSQITYANGEVDNTVVEFIRAKMGLEIDPDSKKGAT